MNSARHPNAPQAFAVDGPQGLAVDPDPFKPLAPNRKGPPVMSSVLIGTVVEKWRRREKIIDNKRFTCYYNVCKIGEGTSGFTVPDTDNCNLCWAVGGRVGLQPASNLIVERGRFWMECYPFGLRSSRIRKSRTGERHE